MAVWFVAGLLVFLLAWVALTFNLLVRRRNRVDEGWAQIDVELTRRYDLVPRLADVVRGYAAHEEAIFTRVAETRAAATRASDLAAHDRADTQLTDALRSLFAVSEAYPELQASEQFLELQDELAHTEDRIAYARGYYNALVVEYETTRRTFPSKVVAGGLGFAPRQPFEADVASRATPGVALRNPGSESV